ncbi:hypothetical protein CAMGR0001_2656 [Campylobacter gracilis RM3268]|uniref:Uncharacterized protein n=1 Tax=Campylobacter gracilis RM3268 TaxID=553220 RepID=C8PF15_9BACT|nr:hypothetical protein CAMGR0001_2656 [Campylobacter gracilis RM3268]
MKNGFRQTSQTSYLKVIFKLYLKFSALNARSARTARKLKFQALAAMRRRFYIAKAFKTLASLKF